MKLRNGYFCLSLLLPVVTLAVDLSTDANKRDLQDAPENDLCESPTLLTDFVIGSGELLEVAGTTTGATQDSIACLGDVRTAVYYQFVTGSTGARYRVSTCHPATAFNTSIYVENAEACDLGCANTQSYYDGDCTDVVEDGYAATVEFFSEPDATYSIAVTGVDAEGTGDFGLTIQEFIVPANDKCEGVEILQPTIDDPQAPVVIGSTVNATPSVLSCQAVELIGVYYQFQGTGGRVRVSTCTPETDFNATIFVDDSVCSDIGCGSMYEEEIIDCDTESGFGETIEFRTEEGINYTMAVRGAMPEDTGTFGLVLYEYVRPSNDICTAPITVEISDDEEQITISGSNENATIASFSCLAEPYPTVFYSVVGTGETFYASTCSENDILDFNSSIIVNEGACDSKPSGCTSTFDDGDFDCDPSGNAATVEWETEEGMEYLIAVKGVSPLDKGSFQLIIQRGGNFSVPTEDSSAISVGVAHPVTIMASLLALLGGAAFL